MAYQIEPDLKKLICCNWIILERVWVPPPKKAAYNDISGCNCHV